MIKKRDPVERLAEAMVERMIAHFDDPAVDRWIGTYILDENHQPVKCDTMTWGRWFNDGDNKRVALTLTRDYEVSTVFLGVDHDWSGKGPPVLYETMVFPLNVIDLKTGKRSGMEDDMDRYCTWEEAEAGHAEMVRKVLDFERSTTERNKA